MNASRWQLRFLASCALSLAVACSDSETAAPAAEVRASLPLSGDGIALVGDAVHYHGSNGVYAYALDGRAPRQVFDGKYRTCPWPNPWNHGEPDVVEVTYV